MLMVKLWRFADKIFKMIPDLDLASIYTTIGGVLGTPAATLYKLKFYG